MQCPRCLNEDPRYFYLGSKGYYCRKCIGFKRVLLDEPLDSPIQEMNEELLDADYQLSFELTPKQKEISDKLAIMIDKTSVLVYAACGSGKTEIVMQSIRKYLKQGLTVGYATPRRQVVIEIGKRMKEAFSKLKVSIVCEGFTNDVMGDLIICTTHQLYRYHQYFDLLILDEPDAFPYYGNDVLKGIVKTSCRKNIIYLTATPDDELKQLFTLQLFKRPHGKDIPVPKVKCLPKSIAYIDLLFWLNDHKRALIFVPTIKKAKRLSYFLNVPNIHSQTLDKDDIIANFRNRHFPYLICTTILERGVTFSEIDVCIVNADHNVFSVASLIQIMGRIGRDINYPYGEGLMICFHKSKKAQECIKQIEMMNA